MFEAPIRPDLSLSVHPDECDFIHIDLDARTVEVRLSGMLTPRLKYDEWVQPACGSHDLNVPRLLVGPMVGGTCKTESADERALTEMVASGARQIRKEYPRGTIYGGSLDMLWDMTRGDPRHDELHASTWEEYLRITGMRRGRDEIEAEWCRIEACRVTGKHPGIEPYPTLTEPGRGCFLS
jgi:hypothetical protein